MDELTSFLVANDRGPFQTADAELASVSSDSVGTVLFGLLDLDRDFQLIAEELGEAMETLHRKDPDDDGTFGISELGTPRNPYIPMSVAVPAEAARPFMVLNPGSVPVGVVRELERRYAPVPSVISGSLSTLSRDPGREDLGLKEEVFNQYDFDSELTRREFPGTIGEFQQLDQNSDGIVDTAEAKIVN